DPSRDGARAAPRRRRGAPDHAAPGRRTGLLDMVSCNPLQPWTDAINQPGQNSGEREFSPPDAGEMFDRVLVVDDEAKNYPPPGSRDRRGVGSFPRSRRPRRVTLGWRLCRLAVRPG